MSWIQVETGRYENGSGWILENDPTFSWIMYNEEMEDEFPDTFLVLTDLFTNPGLSVITLDPVTGKLPTQYLPALAINDTFIVSSQAAMLSLSAERGDIAVRTDLPGPGMFILAGDDPAFLPNWIPLTTTYPDWNNIQNKPAVFPTVNHDHDSRYYTKSESDTLSLQKRNISTPIPAEDITEDSDHRFVTDIQMAIWDAPAGGNISIPLGGIVEDSLNQLPSSNFREPDGLPISRFTYDALWNLVRRVVTSIAPATDRVNVTAHGCIEGQLVKFNFTGGGISASTAYYVRNPTTNDFQISTGSTGGVINLTSSQTGDMITNIEYGFGDGSSTFNVPDRKGIFLRGAGVHGSRAKTSGGNYDGGSVGFAGQDRQISHSHQQYAGDVAGGSYGSGGRYADSGGASAATILYTGSPVSDGTGNPRNSNEVAPAWTAVRYKLRVL